MTAAFYPNVPNVPGVPALLRVASYSIPLPALNALNVAGIRIGQPQWGIFDQGGSLVLSVDSVLEVGASLDFEVPDYPLENGGFESYNKVARPYRSKVRVAVGGNDSRKSAFLTTLSGLITDLNLYTVVTPEFSYYNASVIHYDYHREQRQGASLLTVDIWLQEIRVSATATFSSSSKSVNGALPKSGGQVQSQEIGQIAKSSKTATGGITPTSTAINNVASASGYKSTPLTESQAAIQSVGQTYSTPSSNSPSLSSQISNVVAAQGVN